MTNPGSFPGKKSGLYRYNSHARDFLRVVAYGFHPGLGSCDLRDGIGAHDADINDPWPEVRLEHAQMVGGGKGLGLTRLRRQVADENLQGRGAPDCLDRVFHEQVRYDAGIEASRAE